MAIFDIDGQDCSICANMNNCRGKSFCGTDEIFMYASRNELIYRINKRIYSSKVALMKSCLLDVYGYDYDIESSKIWHRCYMPDVFDHLEHDGTWVPGKWYEWLDIYGNVEVARMKADAWDHFFPPTEIIKEENVIAFREIQKEKENES